MTTKVFLIIKFFFSKFTDQLKDIFLQKNLINNV